MTRRPPAGPLPAVVVAAVVLAGVGAAGGPAEGRIDPAGRGDGPHAAVDALDSPPATTGVQQPPPGWPRAPDVSAASFLLLEAGTGQVVAERASSQRRPVASTVKVLTAITVLRRTSLDDTLTAGEEVTALPPGAAGVGLESGDTWVVEDLLEGLVARSGNDAAWTLAVGVGGGIDDFTDLMRRDAAALGVEGARISTPTGLEDRNRLSARDLAVITRVAMGDERFAAIAGRSEIELPGVGVVASRNELLASYPGATGVKTGYTAAAGRCLVAAAERDGVRLVAIVLGSEGARGHFDDAAALLDFGFERLSPVQATGSGPEIELRRPGGWIPLDAAPAAYLVPRDDLAGPPATSIAVDGDGGREPTGASVVRQVTFPTETTAENGAGDGPGGSVRVVWRGREIGEVALRADVSSSEAGDGAGVAAWLTDRAYASLRAAAGRGILPSALEGGEPAP